MLLLIGAIPIFLLVLIPLNTKIMIWVLLALLVLFTCLYINDRRKNKKQPVVEKKPSDKWYAKKLSDIFYDWKIICDNTNKSR